VGGTILAFLVFFASFSVLVWPFLLLLLPSALSSNRR